MTTKKLIKELMGLNISRNTARRFVRSWFGKSNVI